MSLTMKASMELRKFVVPEVVVGSEASLLIGRYLTHFGSKKAMVVTDRKVQEQHWFHQIIQSISEVGIEVYVFDEATSNPKDFEVMMGAELFLANDCDVIVAVGGGSPMDCAKGIGIVSTNGGHVLDYVGVDEIRLPGPPLICIPTTAGSSADVSQFAIIGDSLAQVKKAIISKKVVPDLALIDPIPLTTMDSYLTACTGIDALTHAIEACVSNARSDLTHVHALSAIGLIHEHLEQAVQPNRSMETLQSVMMASLHAGFAFSNASLGAVHAMAHSLGGLMDLPHGECNGILLEKVMEANFESAEAMYRMIAGEMGIEAAKMSREEVKAALLHRIDALRHSIGIPDYFPADPVSDKQMDLLTASALKDPCMVTNPKTLNKKEVKDIYEFLFQQ